MRAHGLPRRIIGFSSYLAKRFVDDECILWAGALSYSTLLAVVPLSAVVLAAFSAFPVFDTWYGEVETFIFRNFVPAAGETVQEHLRDFAKQASRLSSVGVVFLLVTTLVLVAEIERALNQIWRVRRRRPLASRLAVYWTALTVGPLLIGASLAISSYLVSLPLIRGATATDAGHVALAWLPFAIEVFAFSLAYVIVPNTQVYWRFALAGGTLAAALFESAKYGFAVYVSGVPTYEIIYGALAAVPLFLVWIYLSWVVILLGALFAAALQTFRIEAHLEGWSRSRELQLLFRLVGHLWRAQSAGEGRASSALLDLEPAAKDEQLERLLGGLEASRLASRGASGEWLLARDPAEITLLDLYQSGSFALPSPEETIRDMDEWDDAFCEVLAAAESPVEELLRRRTLKRLYSRAGDEEEREPDRGDGEGDEVDGGVTASGPRPLIG